jgi:hypothetical protein
MAQTDIGNAGIAANIAKGVADKAAGITPGAAKAPANPAEKAVIKNAENGGIEVIDPNAGKTKYVVDGKDVYLSPEQATAYVQKGLAFEPKISQLGRLQQETAAFLDTLSNDPGKVIYNERFGKPQEVLSKILSSTKVSDEIKDTIGQWYYNNVIVPGNMSPEQREAAEWKSKAQAYDQSLKQQAQEKLEQENNARVQQALNTIKAQISEAMTEAGVPLDSKIAPQLARRVAQVMQLGFATGKTITPKEAMAKVRAELHEYQKAYYDVLDEDKLVEQLGKENAEKVRKFYLKAVKAKEDGPKKKEFGNAPKRDERKTMTPDEFRAYLDDLKSKGK